MVDILFFLVKLHTYDRKNGGMTSQSTYYGLGDHSSNNTYWAWDWARRKAVNNCGLRKDNLAGGADPPPPLLCYRLAFSSP